MEGNSGWLGHGRFSKKPQALVLRKNSGEEGRKTMILPRNTRKIIVFLGSFLEFLPKISRSLLNLLRMRMLPFSVSHPTKERAFFDTFGEKILVLFFSGDSIVSRDLMFFVYVFFLIRVLFGHFWPYYKRLKKESSRV